MAGNPRTKGENTSGGPAQPGKRTLLYDKSNPLPKSRTLQLEEELIMLRDLLGKSKLGDCIVETITSLRNEIDALKKEVRQSNAQNVQPQLAALNAGVQEMQALVYGNNPPELVHRKFPEGLVPGMEQVLIEHEDMMESAFGPGGERAKAISDDAIATTKSMLLGIFLKVSHTTGDIENLANERGRETVENILREFSRSVVMVKDELVKLYSPDQIAQNADIRKWIDKTAPQISREAKIGLTAVYGQNP